MGEAIRKIHIIEKIRRVPNWFFDYWSKYTIENIDKQSDDMESLDPESVRQFQNLMLENDKNGSWKTIYLGTHGLKMQPNFVMLVAFGIERFEDQLTANQR